MSTQLTLKDLPFKQFEKLGMTEADVLKLPNRTLNALLSGQKTDLMKFNNVPNVDGSIEGKLSLKRVGNEVTLNITPVKNHIEAKYNLTNKEIADLRNSDKVTFIPKEFVNKTDQKPYKVLVTLDKDTNNFVAIRQSSIKPPEEINNVPLTEKQKIAFKYGKPIDINGDKFIVNPTTELGISNEFGDTRQIKQLKTEKYEYDQKQLAADIALAASGIGSVVLIGHMARLINTTVPQHRENLNNPNYVAAIDKIAKETKDLDVKMSKSDLKLAMETIINKHMEKFDLGIKEGKLIESGVAPYKNDPTKAESFYIKYEDKAGAQKMLWGKDFENALAKSGAKPNDNIKIEYQGKYNVLVPVKEKNDEGREVTVQKTVSKNHWEIYKADPIKQAQMQKVSETDNLKVAKQGNTTTQKSTNPEQIKDTNPSVKNVIENQTKPSKAAKVSVARKTSQKTESKLTEKPKSQEKKSRGKGLKL